MNEDEWWDLDGMEQQLLQQVDYAGNTLYRLPDFMDDPMLPSPLYFAALDSYLVNLRLLVDFWDIRDHRRDGRDFHAVDFVSDWVPEPVECVQRLRDDNWWQVASEQVVHLSRRRAVPDPRDEKSIRHDTTTSNLRKIANQIREIDGIWLQRRREEIGRRILKV